jgi:DNA polymerase I-like protein with 3'-5' exonuclease and polymerase domains/uracil-DNA glycosylase
MMIVGEAPGAEEERRLTPFVGSAGQELDKMLHESGFIRNDFFITNVCKFRPPGNDITQWIYEKKSNPPAGFVHFQGKWVHPVIKEGCEELFAEISAVKPQLIIALGKTALWALTRGAKDAIGAWRGSQLILDGYRVIPTIHPATVLRQWEMRSFVLLDLRRARRWLDGLAEPREYRFLVRPSFSDCISTISTLLENPPPRLSVDLETRFGHIACCGIAWSPEDAISIPFMCTERHEGYWSLEEETAIILKLRELFTHPRVSITGQNFNYDTQYIWRHWRFIPNFRDDTMIAQATVLPGLPKTLYHIASMYNRHYVYWKDDGKEWDPKLPEEQLWSYNCEDACRTWEAMGELSSFIDSQNLRPQYTALLRRWFAVLQMQIRGVRIDESVRSQVTLELMNSIASHEEWLNTVCSHPLNVGSSKQMQSFFYDDLRLPIQRHRKSGRPTLDDKALETLAIRQPLIRPLVKTIQNLRSLRVFLNTFAKAPLDFDRRMRTEFNVVGTETYRFSSSENPFGSGTNLQNLPKGNEKPKPGELILPNIRKLFIPDPGFLICDADLDRADLQVVVWEADDAELKQALREGADIHAENAKVLGISRQLAKIWVHGTNYGGSPRTMAANCGITVAEAERLRKRWFQAHPGIERWHNDVRRKLMETRSVSNRFGFRRIYFDRIESVIPEALAWIPQSTVAHIINEGLLNLAVNVPECQVLLQVHDSLVFQLPANRRDLLPLIREQLLIPVPYPDPLIIPVGLKTSSVSWGHVEDTPWGS